MCNLGLNEWGDIANIIFALMSVLTAIITAVVLFKQLKLQKQSAVIQYNGIQPIFRIYYNYLSNSNSKENDSVQIRIMNEGYKTKNTPKIAIHTFLRIHHHEINKPKQISYLKIENFYRYTKHSSAGNDALKVGHFKNNLKYYRNILETLNSSNSDITKIERVDLIKIEYRDINDVSHTVYFMDYNSSDMETYDSILSFCNKTNKRYRINELKFADIIRYIDNI